MKALTSPDSIGKFVDQLCHQLDTIIKEQEELRIDRIRLSLDMRVSQAHEFFEQSKYHSARWYSAPKKANVEYRKWKSLVERLCSFRPQWFQYEAPPLEIVDIDEIVRQNKQRFREEWALTKQYIQGKLNLENIRSGEYFQNNFNTYVIDQNISNATDHRSTAKHFRDKVSMLHDVEKVMELTLSDQEIGGLERIVTYLDKV